MATTITNESKISIKVTVEKQTKWCTYAEADHTFVDVLFSFMTLPLVSIVRLLRKQTDKKNIEVFQSLHNLYQSLVDLPDRFFMNEECKYTILNPRSRAYDQCRKLKVNIDDTEPKKYFVCQGMDCARKYRNYSNYCKASCRHCGQTMNQEVPFLDDDDNCVEGGVLVSNATTYIITDDLRVIPFTPGCCIQLLVDFGVKDASHLEEKTVVLGYQQIIDLLGLALSCNSPLTYLVLSSSRQSIIIQDGFFDVCTSADEKDNFKMFLQVSLQKSTGKLLFVEAEEDFVYFISGFLAISLGTVISKFMNANSPLVCMENILKSISDLSSERYFISQTQKDILLKPHFGQEYYEYSTTNQIFPSPFCCKFPVVFLSQTSISTEKVHDDWFFSYSSKALYMIPNDPKVDFLLFKRSGMFMLTNDLVITPTSTVSTMNTLSKCNVSLNDIERHKVCIGFKEKIKMLKASMISSSALSKGLEHQLKNLNRRP